MLHPRSAALLALLLGSSCLGDCFGPITGLSPVLMRGLSYGIDAWPSLPSAWPSLPSLEGAPRLDAAEMATLLAQAPEPSPLVFAALAAAGFRVGSSWSNGPDGAGSSSDRAQGGIYHNKNNPYPSTGGRYNAADAERYFGLRPALVAGRALRIAGLSFGFGAGLLADRLFNDEAAAEAKMPERAAELTALLTKLGPTFIKIGQSLSIRSDLLPPAYIRGLEQLQDQVPPFPTEEARRIIEEELKHSSSVPGLQRLEDVFESLSAEPVAAASLGQVYRGKLRADFLRKVRALEGGEETDGEKTSRTSSSGGGSDSADVAVKVQRPDIIESVALDMFLIRTVGPLLKKAFSLNTDIVGTVDDWGVGFIDGEWMGVCVRE